MDMSKTINSILVLKCPSRMNNEVHNWWSSNHFETQQCLDCGLIWDMSNDKLDMPIINNQHTIRD